MHFLSLEIVLIINSFVKFGISNATPKYCFILCKNVKSVNYESSNHEFKSHWSIIVFTFPKMFKQFSGQIMQNFKIVKR